MTDHPTFITLPGSSSQGQQTTLRSALKQPSRPSTPGASPTTTSPPATSNSNIISNAQSTSTSTNTNNSTYFNRTQRSPKALSPALPNTMLPPTSPSHHAHTLIPLPLAAGFAPKVSFDTFENPVASMFSYTLRVETDGYERTRSTRVFLCASSPDVSGAEALDWAMESLVQDGDELVVFRGVPEDVLEKDHESCREDARELMRHIQEKTKEYDPDRKLHIIVEFIAGKVTDTIDRLIALYRPDSVVVGTRGQKNVLGAWGAAFVGSSVGSVSKYCLSRSPVPIIVVRPEAKVRKNMAKRRADPKRGKHFDTMTTPSGGGAHGGVPMSWSMTK